MGRPDSQLVYVCEAKLILGDILSLYDLDLLIINSPETLKKSQNLTTAMAQASHKLLLHRAIKKANK